MISSLHCLLDVVRFNIMNLQFTWEVIPQDTHFLISCVDKRNEF